MHPVTLRAFHEELEKVALLERLVRLGATDIPHTPRLVMKHRSPQELAALQTGVDTFFKNKVQGPIERFGEKGVTKLPSKAQPFARKMVGHLAQNPETLLLEPIPIPGVSLMYVGAKKGLERAIDRFAPAAAAAV